MPQMLELHRLAAARAISPAQLALLSVAGIGGYAMLLSTIGASRPSRSRPSRRC
ncbi:MAG: hypothetical protein M3Y41_04950 [Pseudomonadota bacterium]|nr:hypothetical protein [Pseudomonadota bacterium]